MDTVELIIKEILSERSVRNCRFTANFLNDVADVYDTYGSGTTRVFLLDKKERRQLKDQAEALLAVLKVLTKYQETKVNRGIGRYIIKTLATIKSLEA